MPFGSSAADLDLGLLLVRMSIGPMLLVHGLNKVLGDGGLSGTAAWFEGLDLRPGRLHARMAAGTEVVAGVLITIGFLTGLASLAFVGLMVVAALTDHRGKGYFVFKGGSEYVAVVAGAAIALAAAGPGDWSIDSALSIDMFGLWWAGIAAVGGVAGATAFLAVFRHSSAPAEAGQ